MGFLVRRGKRAVAGWSDDFNRPNESPVLEPWQFWGDQAAYALVDQRLRLAAEGQSRGGNFDGGIAFEHQPLTPTWVVEFVRSSIGTTTKSKSNETKQAIFLDKNWTEGGNASSTLYQVAIELESKYTPEEEPDENGDGGKAEKMDYYIRISTRDKVNTTQVWVFTIAVSIGGDTESVTASVWAAALKLRFHIYNDRYIVGYVNDTQRLFADMYDPNFRFGPKKRSANFAQVSGLVASIDEFKTYDLPESNQWREIWAEIFYDSFDRNNSTTVGNGWTQTSGNSWGVWNKALSMYGGPFDGGTDGFRQVRRNTGSTDMKVEFVLGGVNEGTSSLSDQTPVYVLGRLSADGKRGLCVYIQEKTLTLTGFSWTGVLSNVPVLDPAPFFTGIENAFLPAIPRGTRYSITISGDKMWLTNETLGRVVAFKEGVNSIVPASSGNTWAGAVIMRNFARNSISIGEIRLYV